MKKLENDQKQKADLMQPLSSEHVMPPRSHLTKTLTKKAKRNIVLVIVGLLLLLGIGLTVGPKLLVQFSLLLERENSQAQQNVKETTADYIAPPFLNSTFSATNSARLTISGTADNAEKVKVYINGKSSLTANVRSDNTFRGTVTLTEGDNSIKARSVTSHGTESSFSQSVSILYDNKAPELTLTSPSDGDSFEKDDSPITISGKSENDVVITINSFQAIIDNTGEFSYSLPLKDGGNEITITATDPAGNKTEKKVTVNYSS